MKKSGKKIKKQHYVPEMYLKGFASYKKKQHYLWVYNKENQKIFYSSIRNIGHEHYFYDIDEEQTIEKLMSKFEANFNVALQKLIKTEDITTLDIIDKQVLSQFIAVQLLRTKEQRIVNKEIMNGTLEFIGKHSIKNFKAGSVKFTEDSVKKFHINTIFRNYQKIADIILNEMAWKLRINYTDTSFWTSDNPCARYNELEPEPFRGNLGFKCKGFELHFPVSSKLLLVLMNPNLLIRDLDRIKVSEYTLNFKETIPFMGKTFGYDTPMFKIIPDKVFVNKEDVIFENNLQIISSTQFIFSKEKNFNLADKYLKEYPYYQSKDRKRIKIN